MARPDWHGQAACAGVGPSIFFAAGDGVHRRRPGAASYNAARRLCAACPVIAECAIEGTSEQFGIWGGLSPVERLSVRPEIGRIA
jgi:hypothetical protein